MSVEVSSSSQERQKVQKKEEEDTNGLVIVKESKSVKDHAMDHLDEHKHKYGAATIATIIIVVLIVVFTAAAVAKASSDDTSIAIAAAAIAKTAAKKGLKLTKSSIIPPKSDNSASTSSSLSLSAMETSVLGVMSMHMRGTRTARKLEASTSGPRNVPPWKYVHINTALPVNSLNSYSFLF
jgi:hypothetical protein